MSLWGNPEKDTEKNVSKLAKANLVFKPESHCKSIVSICTSTVDQRGLLWMVSKRLGNPSQVRQKSWTSATTLLSYLCIDSRHFLAPWHAHFSNKGNEQCHHRKVVSPTRTSLTWMHVWYVVEILCDKSFAALQLFRLFKCCVISTIKARSCIHSEDWNSSIGLPFFIIKFSIASCK